MATVLRDTVAAPSVQPSDRGQRFWESFVAELSGLQTPAFDVFVARSDPASARNAGFRTLVWTASAQDERLLLSTAEQCLATLCDDPGFRLLDPVDDADVTVLAAANSPTSKKDLAHVFRGGKECLPDLANSTLNSIKFARLDYRTTDGVSSFSCRTLESPNSFEFAVLLEEAFLFTHAALAWCLQTHAVEGLRDPTTVDFSQLETFLNVGWNP